MAKSSVDEHMMNYQSKPISKEIINSKLQDNKEEKNFTFENFLNNSDVEKPDKEDINNFLIDNNFTTNESDNIDNKLFIQTDESLEQADYQMTENTHNAITNALRNI